jgi:hypothetical protein
VLYTRAAALFRDLALARADGSQCNLLAQLSRVDVLVVDDWAIAAHRRTPFILGQFLFSRAHRSGTIRAARGNLHLVEIRPGRYTVGATRNRTARSFVRRSMA